MPTRLHLLQEQDQPRVADGLGALGPPPAPPGVPAPDDGPVATAPPTATPQDISGAPDSFAPTQAGPKMSEDEIDETLSNAPLTGEKAKQIQSMAEAIDVALRPDEEPEPDPVLALPDAELIGLVQARLERATAFRQPFEDRWKEAWMDFQMYLRDRGAKWQSKVFLPLVYQQVTSAIPPIISAVFDSGPVWEAQPTKPEWESKARALTHLMDWYARVKTPLDRRLRDGIFWTVLLGTGFFRTWWDTWRGTKRTMKSVYLQGVDGSNGPLIGKRMAVKPGALLEDRPMLGVIDPWNAYPAPHTTDDDYIPWFIERVEQTVEELISDADEGKLGPDGPARVKGWLETKPDQSEQIGSWAGGTTRADAFHSVGLSSPFDNPRAEEDKDQARNLVVTYVMRTDDHVVTVSGDGTKVLGKAPNPSIHRRVPIIPMQFERIPGCIFGRGIGDVLAGIQAQVNFNYNKGNDAIQLALNSPIAVRAAGNALVQGQVAWQPGVLIPCRDPNSDIKPLEIKDPMARVLALEDHLLMHADRATGVNDITRGQTPQGANTATEFAGLQSQVRIRLSQHVREIRHVLARIARLWFSDIQQFVTAELVIRVTGRRGLEFLDIKPEDLDGEFDFLPSANMTRSNPTILRQDVAALMPTVTTSPVVKQDKWMAHVFKVFEVENFEDMIQEPPPPPRDPEAEEQALELGVDIDPSPDEDFAQHMLVHQAYLSQTNPMANPLAYAARKKHFEKTLILQSEVFQAQAGAPAQGAAGQQPAPGGAGGGTEARQGATILSRAQGNQGVQGQKSPGPASAPGRPTKK